MNTDLRDIDYDKHGRIVRRCKARVSRLHDVHCEYCRGKWRAEHPFCERVECPDCGRLTQVETDSFDSECFVPSELLPTVEMLR